jgi:hypothetical protein
MFMEKRVAARKERSKSGDKREGLSFAPTNNFAGGEWSGKRMFTVTVGFRLWLAT